MAKKKKEESKKRFKLKFENSKVLKNIVETLSSIIDEANFIVAPERFSVKAMDPSRICLLELIIEKDNFKEYDCKEKFQVGLNLSDFDKILKRCGLEDTIELNYNDEDKKIKIRYQNEEATRIRAFSLTCLDLEIEEVPMDSLNKIEYSSSWSFEPNLLVEAIKDAEIYSEILNFEAKEGVGLNLSSSGQIGEMEYQLGLETFFEVNLDKIQKGAFSLAFLKSIMKLSSIVERLKIFLKEGHPLKMVFELLEGAKLDYFLAPRVEEIEETYDDFEDAEFEEVEEEKLSEDSEEVEGSEDELLEEVE